MRLGDGSGRLRAPRAGGFKVQFADGALAEDQLIDWPPVTGDGFVVNCCGDDPLGCVKYLREYYTGA